MNSNLERIARSVRATHRPHALAKDEAGQLFEFISYPYVKADMILIEIRKPGDPNSIKTVQAAEMILEFQECSCNVLAR